MRVVSLKMNSNVYSLKNTNSNYLLLNTTIIPLCNSKISLISLWGKLIDLLILPMAKRYDGKDDKEKMKKKLKIDIIMKSNYSYMVLE